MLFQTKNLPSDTRNSISLDCESLEPRMMLSSVQVIAAGTTGAEQIELEVNGAVVQTWNNLGSGAYGGEFTTLSFQTSGTTAADDVRINFVNDLYDEANSIDRNVRIDAIIIDGQRFETESPDVYSTGTWLPADGVVAGNRQSEYLHTDGYFQFAGEAVGGGSQVVINAFGNEGGEEFNLLIDGQVVDSFTASATQQAFTYSAADTVTADQVRIEFTNDEWVPNVSDRNLIVDSISIDGQVFETEAPSVYSTGTWLPADGVVAGFRQSETLHTNGYFQFGSGVSSSPGVIGFTVDQITIDENSGQINVLVFRNNGSDGAVSVDYQTNFGTTNAGDHQQISGTINFADGETNRNLTLSITDDTLVESDETFSLVLSNVTGGATLSDIDTQTVIIRDNDVLTGVIFEESFEGSSQWTTNPFGTDTATTGMWAAGSPVSTSSSGITLQPSSGHTGTRALITGLAAGTSVGTYDIDNGVTSSLSPQINLPANAEIELSFEYSFAYLNNATADDFFSVSIVANGVTTELYLDHAHSENQAASWRFVAQDISTFAGQSIQILVQAADAGTGSIVEAGLDDVVVEVLPTGPGIFNVESTGVNLDESAGTATIVVSRTSGRDGTASVQYTTVAGTASTADFTPRSGTLVFADGQSEATITVPIIDDNVEESLESFRVQISNPTNGATIGSDSFGTVTIVDNDNATQDFLPDMIPIASTLTEQLRLDTTEISGRTLMRFSTELANGGDGPLEIWGGSTTGNSQQVFQRIYQEGGGHRDVLAGEFIYHPEHGHIHFEAFATYDLQLLGANGAVIASGGKTSFCLINIRQPLPDVTANADVVHGRGGNSCGTIQGISTGYSDVYSSSLDGQWIDVTDVADGTYTLQITADPENRIQETNENNNVASVTVTISNGQVVSNG